MTAHVNWELILSNTGDYIINTDTNEKILDVCMNDDSIIVIPHRLFADSITLQNISDIREISVEDEMISILYFDNTSKEYNKFVDISPIIH